MQKTLKNGRRIATSFVFKFVLVTVGFVLVGCQVTPPAPQPRPPVEPSRPIPPQPQPTPVPPAERGRIPLAPIVAPTSGSMSYYQDRQEQYLRGRLENTGLRVSRTGDVLKIIVPGVGFMINGDQLQPRMAQALDGIAPVLKEFTKTSIDIKGFTDSTGSFEHNQNLSERRAQSVGAYLAEKQIPTSRIRTAGFGPRSPIADNRTDTGRAQNRRVEIELVPSS